MSTGLICFGIGILMRCMPLDAAPAQTATIVCPPLVGWAASDQKAAALELKKLPAGHPLRKMAVVTVRQRNLVKACERSQ